MSGGISHGRPELDRSTALAFARTRAAYERTMMAWIRTATSLIAFGFSVYKFFQLEEYRKFEPNRRIGPREFAIALVSIGIVSLLLATIEYRQNMRALREESPDRHRSLAVFVAALLSLLGIVAFVLMVFRQ